MPERELGDPCSDLPFGPLLEPVLAIHICALVHVCLGHVGTTATGDALLDTLADKATHQKGATSDTPVGLGGPGDLRLLRQSLAPLSYELAYCSLF